jgi:hypothetical protein
MGAPPALLWAADHPEEVAGLLYAEGPVMLSAVLTKIIAYTPECPLLAGRRTASHLSDRWPRRETDLVAAVGKPGSDRRGA